MEPNNQMRTIRNVVDKDIDIVRKITRERIWGYIAAALGLVAGLAWNDAIKSLIEHFFPAPANSVWAKLGYAIIITIIVVFVMVGLEKFFKKDNERK